MLTIQPCLGLPLCLILCTPPSSAVFRCLPSFILITLHFASNTALLAESPNELLAMVNRGVEVSENLGYESQNLEDWATTLGKGAQEF